MRSDAMNTEDRVRVGEKQHDNDRPRAEWVRGKCPKCGDDVVSNCYYIGGRGYVIFWQCWSSLSRVPTCDYEVEKAAGGHS